MKIAAGIVGILIGITSIIYIGLIGGIVGSATSWLGSGPWAQGDTRVNDLGQLISLLSYLSGLLAIIGGIVAFSNPLVAGIILAGSAFSHWYLLGFGVVGKVFILPIAAAAFFAFLSSDTKQKPVPSDTSIKKSDQTGSDEGNATTANYDRAKWDALVKYDKDIALIAEKLRPLEQKWLDEFASSYLAINDKTYLPEIEKKIFAAAKIEKEINEIKRNSKKEQYERKRIYEEEQQRAFSQEQERLTQERKEKFRRWRDFFWGSAIRKTITICIAVAMLVFLYWSIENQLTAMRTTSFIQAIKHHNDLKARELIHQGINPNADIEIFGSPLIWALRKSEFEGDRTYINEIKLLIERGANVNYVSPSGFIPMLIASDLSGSLDVLRLLLTHGADVNIKDNNGITALCEASCRNSTIDKNADFVNLLIGAHADVNVDCGKWVYAFT